MFIFNHIGLGLVNLIDGLLYLRKGNFYSEFVLVGIERGGQSQSKIYRTPLHFSFWPKFIHSPKLIFSTVQIILVCSKLDETWRKPILEAGKFFIKKSGGGRVCQCSSRSDPNILVDKPIEAFSYLGGGGGCGLSNITFLSVFFA